jgi:polar amino acid transport system substrate-binding protein
MKTLSTSLCLLLSLILIVCSLQAAERYRIGVEDLAYLPFYQAENGEYIGYTRDLLDAFAKSEGITFEYVPLPVKRLYKLYLDPAQKLDFKFPDNSYWAKDLKKGHAISYSTGLVAFVDGVMALPKRQSMKLDQLKVLGTIRGFTPWDYLGEIEAKRVKKSESNSLKSLLKMAMLGRVDGIYVNVDVARYLLVNRLDSAGKLKFLEGLPHTKSSYSMSTYRHPKVLKRLDQWLKRNQKLQQQLLTKWKLTK